MATKKVKTQNAMEAKGTVKEVVETPKTTTEEPQPIKPIREGYQYKI